MEENMEQQGLSVRQKRALFLAVGLTALIVAVYLGLCLYVGASRTVLPGVWSEQMELSGMTEEEAARALDRWVEDAYADAVYELQCGSSQIQVSGNIAQLDSAAAAREAWLVGRSEPFLKRGAVILSHLVGRKTIVPGSVELNEAGKARMEEVFAQLDRAEGVALVETVWSVNGDQLIITRGITGASVDRERAVEALQDVMRQLGSGTVKIPMAYTQPVPLDLQELHGELYAQAADAFVERDEQGKVQIVPHVVGVDFDAVWAQEQFDGTAEGAMVHIPLTVTVPDVTENALQSKLFRDVIGECNTNIGGTEYRLNNVIVAAKAMDGVILMPGEVFSYNETLGPRTEANGYLPAPAYIGGKTVDDVGGGICQNSSTLYLAVLRANLEIVERTNHMYTVGYVPDGLDATVAFNAIDFKFRNSTDYPIRMEAQVSGRKLYVKLYGTETEKVTVKMVTETLSTTPYTVTYKPDSEIAVGKTEVETTAYTGCKVQVFRCVYDERGNLISKTKESVNNYRHRDKVILYNPADAQRWGLVDENGVVHTTVQPQKPAPQPEPVAPEPVEPDSPTVAPQPEEQSAPDPEQEAVPDETVVVVPNDTVETPEGV